MKHCKRNKVKPVISTLQGTRIIYKCPKCNTEFFLYDYNEEKFCHNCGIGLCWTGLHHICSGKDYLNILDIKYNDKLNEKEKKEKEIEFLNNLMKK